MNVPLTESNRKSLISALKIATKISGRDGLVSINFASGVVTGFSGADEVSANFGTDPWSMIIMGRRIMSPEVIVAGTWGRTILSSLFSGFDENTVEFTMMGAATDPLTPKEGFFCSSLKIGKYLCGIPCLSPVECLDWRLTRRHAG